MTSLGFGCNGDGNDYKVVKFFRMNKNLAAEVYSSNLDSWTPIMEVGIKVELYEQTNRLVVNSIPYWIAFLDDKSASYDERMGLLGFNADTMGFEFVSQPRAKGEHCYVNWK